MESLIEKIKNLPKVRFKLPKAEYCAEVRLMEELNKQNRKKYEKWLYMRKLTDKILRENSYRTYAT